MRDSLKNGWKKEVGTKRCGDGKSTRKQVGGRLAPKQLVWDGRLAPRQVGDGPLANIPKMSGFGVNCYITVRYSIVMQMFTVG